jgi:hypothetical protein
MNALSLSLLLSLCAAAQAQMPGGPGPGGPAAAPEAAAASGLSAAQADAPKRRPKEKDPEVAASTGGVRALDVDDVYGGAKLRDPFMKLSGAGASAAAVAAPPKDYDPEEFSIHQLELKGIMKDKAGMTALLVDMNSRFPFILRGGRLYDMRKKPVKGVTGVIKPAQKTVTLTTADKDVQTLRLGEDADEAEE